MQDHYTPPADVAACPHCAAEVPTGGAAHPDLRVAAFAWRCLACDQEWHEDRAADGVTRYWTPLLEGPA